MAGAPHTEGLRNEGMRVHVLYSLVMRGPVGNRIPSPLVLYISRITLGTGVQDSQMYAPPFCCLFLKGLQEEAREHAGHVTVYKAA